MKRYEGAEASRQFEAQDTVPQRKDPAVLIALKGG
jgi:hypothetical protein